MKAQERAQPTRPTTYLAQENDPFQVFLLGWAYSAPQERQPQPPQQEKHPAQQARPLQPERQASQARLVPEARSTQSAPYPQTDWPDSEPAATNS